MAQRHSCCLEDGGVRRAAGHDEVGDAVDRVEDLPATLGTGVEIGKLAESATA